MLRRSTAVESFLKRRLPSAVVSSSALVVNVKDHGAVGNGIADDTAAIQAADTAAYELGPGAVVSFPEGTYLFSQTLLISAPWVGKPRKSILKAAEAFTYEQAEGPKQFSAINRHFKESFNAATADQVFLYGLDWEVLTSTASAGKGSIGFANVAGGEVKNCRFTSVGASKMGALVDLYACVKSFRVDRVYAANATQGAEGGAMWVRNITSAPTEAVNVTEDILITQSTFVTTTNDEGLAVYGVNGMTRKVRVQHCTIEGAASTQEHSHIASTFPFSKTGEKPHAAVEDVIWDSCRFIDVTGSIKEGGSVLVFGQTGDEKEAGNICQNIKAVNCTFIVRATKTKVKVARNVADRYEGGTSGNAVIDCTVNAVGSTEAVDDAFNGFPEVINPTAYGNITNALRNCSSATGGTVEANSHLFHDCAAVTGVRGILSKTTGTAMYCESATAPEASMRGCAVTGGTSLLGVNGAVTSASHIDITDNRMATTGESGNVVTAGTAARVRLCGNTLTGPTALSRTGTIAESTGNDWYGVLEEPHIPGSLLIPSAVHVYKNPSEAATEEKKAKVHSGPRELFNTTTLVLTSGTPLIGLEEVPPFTVISWIGVYTVAVEKTPANRTHLFVALLNEAGEVLEKSLDYTSAANTPMSALVLRAIYLTTPYETGASWTRLRPLICETVSAEAALTIASRENNALLEEPPVLCGTGNAGQTTPAELPGTLTITPTIKRPYFVLG